MSLADNQWVLFGYPVMGLEPLHQDRPVQMGCDIYGRTLAIGIGERSTFGFRTVYDLYQKVPPLLLMLLRKHPKFLGPVWMGQISHDQQRIVPSSPRNQATFDAFNLTNEAALEAWIAGRSKVPFPSSDFLATDDESLVRRVGLFAKSVPYPAEARS